MLAQFLLTLASCAVLRPIDSSIFATPWTIACQIPLNLGLCVSHSACPTLCDPMDCMEPTRLLCLRNALGKNTGVGCHFLLQPCLVKTDKMGFLARACVRVCPRSCPTLCNPMDYSPLDSSVHGILQARIPEWVAISFSRGSSRCRDWIHISFVPCLGRRILYH